LRREIQIERQPVEVRRGEATQIFRRVTRQVTRAEQRVTHDHVGQIAQRLFLVEGAAQRQQRVLAFEHHGAVKRPQRARQIFAGELDEQLGHPRPATGQMHVGQKPLELEPHGICGLELAWKTDRNANGSHTRSPQPRRQIVDDIRVERIPLRLGIPRNLLGRGQRKRRPIPRKTELQRRIRSRDQPAPRLDGLDRALIRLSVEERDRILQHPPRLGNPRRRRQRVSTGPPQATPDQLIFMAQRRQSRQLRQPRLQSRRHPGQALSPQQPVPPLDIGVDRQHLDPLRPQKSRQHRHRQIRRRRITRRRIDECNLQDMDGVAYCPRQRKSVPPRA